MKPRLIEQSLLSNRFEFSNYRIRNYIFVSILGYTDVTGFHLQKSANHNQYKYWNSFMTHNDNNSSCKRNHTNFTFRFLIFLRYNYQNTRKGKEEFNKKVTTHLNKGNL